MCKVPGCQDRAYESQTRCRSHLTIHTTFLFKEIKSMALDIPRQKLEKFRNQLKDADFNDFPIRIVIDIVQEMKKIDRAGKFPDVLPDIFKVVYGEIDRMKEKHKMCAEPDCSDARLKRYKLCPRHLKGAIFADLAELPESLDPDAKAAELLCDLRSLPFCLFTQKDVESIEGLHEMFEKVLNRTLSGAFIDNTSRIKKVLEYDLRENRHVRFCA